MTITLALPPTTQVTLRIPLQPGPEPEEIAVLTFDPDRVSPEQLQGWMRLHKNAYYYVPVIGFYPDCKPGDIPKLKADIKKAEQLVSELDPGNYPAKLAGVVRYLKEFQASSLWMAQQYLAFLKTGKLPDTAYNSMALACRVPASAGARLCHQLLFDWNGKHSSIHSAFRNGWRPE